ncbi:MAG: ATP-binding protein [Bacteroidales bacterium]|jgi:signal transduction histidine kinase|nr:ATP-binding protein [Bacteroidales bacterium]
MAQFKTRARALDLLGRQQIAGIPTAINELIKNAHDAYADKFDIDFIRKDNLLILRDDGLGMTKDEFETRWLIIGTESKFANKKTTLPPVDNSKPIRPIMGEKGIGRLAIASVGKQVLIISKAKLRDKDHKIVVAFINWELFELPGINLEDIVIPIKEFENLPNKNDIENIKSEVILSLDNLLKQNIIPENDYDRIIRSINSFSVNPAELNGQLVGKFEMSVNKGGTFFYISPVNEILISDIEGDKNSKDATPIEKMLIGFHNTMTPEHSEPVIDISFRDYKGYDGIYTNLVNKDEWFTSEEFELADHHFQGGFDKFGQFKGTVKIYGEKTYDHIVHWRDNDHRETNCGAFKISLAYLQGELKSSRVTPEDYSRIRAKGDKFGGLYIYKDNIRILPYGNSDYDYLDIEKNRSKRASTGFFSYRRMFGVIELSTENNGSLVEKAGREGFIENKAYRQMQAILKNFFIQLAADFFDEKGKTPQSEYWNQRKEEFNNHYLALERRDKLAKGRKDKFLKELDRFFTDLTSGTFENTVDNILTETRNNFNSIIYYYENLDEVSQKIIDCEFSARQQIFDYKKRITVSGPRGFTISKAARIDFETYLKEFQILEKTLFKNATEEIDNIVTEYTNQLDIEISKRKRLEQAVEQISIEAKKANTIKKNETNEIVVEVSKKVKEFTSELILDLDNQIRNVKDRLKTLSMIDFENFDLIKERKAMEDDIENISSRNTSVMDRIIRQFESFYIEKDIDGKIVTNDQITDALSEEVEDLRERIQTDIELSQLGLAVGILNHEFNSTVRSIRSSLRDLRAWSDIDTQMENVYKNLKTNFEHLDQYLNLFTPLNRRLNRNKEYISLWEIKTFLLDLFGARFERHNIKFKHTKGYASQKIYGFRSTFYPVFVNIIDNAIYWLKQSDAEEKIIRLHADETGIYISNNGIEIQPQDKERIFELGFSRKPNGRGMGLNISMEVLNAENYNIYVATPKAGSTVTFKIEKKD